MTGFVNYKAHNSDHLQTVKTDEGKFRWQRISNRVETQGAVITESGADFNTRKAAAADGTEQTGITEVENV